MLARAHARTHGSHELEGHDGVGVGLGYAQDVQVLVAHAHEGGAPDGLHGRGAGEGAAAVQDLRAEGLSRIPPACRGNEGGRASGVRAHASPLPLPRTRTRTCTRTHAEQRLAPTAPHPPHVIPVPPLDQDVPAQVHEVESPACLARAHVPLQWGPGGPPAS